jgi:hypothetical protein
LGAGNSGAEISLEVVLEHPTWGSGRVVGHVPFRIETAAGWYIFVPLVIRFLFHYRVLCTFAQKREIATGLAGLSTPFHPRQNPKSDSNNKPAAEIREGNPDDAGQQKPP